MATSQNVCSVQPVQAFLSTNINSRTKTYEDLAMRVLRQLGYPTQSVELHRDQIYECISIAMEFFYKYAGYTEEYLVFDSRLYENDKGLRIDKLCTIASTAACEAAGIDPKSMHKTYDHTIEIPKRNYVAIRDIPREELPRTIRREIKNFTVVTAEEYDAITAFNPGLCEFFRIDKGADMTLNGERVANQPEEYENAFDYDLMDYRKVIEVIDYSESSNQSLNSLFSFESALASQAYFTYQFSLRGFDLLSFHTLNEFLKTRRRTLALDRTWSFDKKTQMFSILPQPRNNQSFYGVLRCYIEKPIRDVIAEMWIYKYTLAQCMKILGIIRGRFGTVNLGSSSGGSLADNLNLRETGIKQMEELEKELIEGTAYSARKFPHFFIG